MALAVLNSLSDTQFSLARIASKKWTCVGTSLCHGRAASSSTVWPVRSLSCESWKSVSSAESYGSTAPSSVALPACTAPAGACARKVACGAACRLAAVAVSKSGKSGEPSSSGT